MAKKVNLDKEKILESVRSDARNISRIPVELLMDDVFMDQVIDAANEQCQKFVDYIRSSDKSVVCVTAYNYMKTIGKMVIAKQKAVKEAKKNAGIVDKKEQEPYQTTIKNEINTYFSRMKEDK